MIEHVPQLGEVTCTPAFMNGPCWERRSVREVVEVHTTLAELRLQSRPRPHVPPETQIALQIEARLACLRVGRVRIRFHERRGQWPEAALEVGSERCCLH